MVFIWMANRLFHCLRTWKLSSQGQHEAAGLAWVLSCGFESVVSMSQGTLGDLESCSLPETRKGHSNWRFPGGLSFAMTWPGSKAQINMGLSFLLLLLLLKNLLVYNLHIRNVSMWSVWFHEVLQMYTSEPSPESRMWVTSSHFARLLLFLYQLLNWVFHISTEDTKEIPQLKNSLLVWKKSNHSCLIEIAECIKKLRSGWITKMRNLRFWK